MLPRTHGSAVFTRGETQALVTATLGTADDQQKIETVDGETWKRFMLHYNFPPFSVGEVQFLRGPGRREIGHGALAERALTPMMPAEEKFPYTVRVVSDILESNGSSSMASVCGGSLAMMDAGVPLKAPVAGVAMGLIMDEQTGKYAVLTDIAGAEDHYGDMDFKVAGTADGHHRAPDGHQGLGHHDRDHEQGARAGARRAGCSSSTRCRRRCRPPRTDVSTHAPRIVTIRIPVDKIRDVIGPGGKMIRSIIERTGVKIDVEDDGRVNVASADEASAQKAIGIIQELTATPELNKTYMGKVQRITDFGAFVEIMPGLDGLLHVSEIAHYRVKDVRDELKEGDQVMVKVINIDPSGKIRLSRKALLQPEEGPENAARRPGGNQSSSRDVSTSGPQARPHVLMCAPNRAPNLKADRRKVTAMASLTQPSSFDRCGSSAAWASSRRCGVPRTPANRARWSKSPSTATTTPSLPPASKCRRTTSSRSPSTQTTSPTASPSMPTASPSAPPPARQSSSSSAPTRPAPSLLLQPDAGRQVQADEGGDRRQVVLGARRFGVRGSGLVRPAEKPGCAGTRKPEPRLRTPIARSPNADCRARTPSAERRAPSADPAVRDNPTTTPLSAPSPPRTTGRADTSPEPRRPTSGRRPAASSPSQAAG